ncbi:MAG: hypothetical protein IKF29_00175 [Oceanobacillus sp.]|nr:hypothetical protein [Oceanobacillus sp.]
MSNTKYGDIIGIRPNFSDTYDLTAEKENSWKSFITNARFEENLQTIFQSFDPTPSNRKNRKSVWIQGTYGTGKSHSTAVVKHLLSDEMSEIQDFLNSLANKQLREVIKSYRSNYKCFPVVLKGRYTINDVQDLMYEIQIQTRKALEKEGIVINVKTDYDTAISLLDDPAFESFWNTLLNNELKPYCQSINDIRKELNKHDKDILGIIDKKFKTSTKSSFGASSIVDWLYEVKTEISNQGIANSLVIIWDEFTSLLSGTESRSILNTVQDIAELSKADDENGYGKGVYIMLVTHRFMEQTDAFKAKDADEQRLALDRFAVCRYEMQPNTTYHILSSTLDRKNEEAIDKLIDERIKQDFRVNEVIDRIVEENSDIGSNMEIREKIVSLYPLHPYTAYLSTFVSRQLGASERSIFNFINDDQVGLKKFLSVDIEDKPFLSTDSIWDFYLKINNSENQKVASIISKYNMHFEDVKKKGAKHLKVFKTVLLLNSLNSVVEIGEESNERNLVVPKLNNILDCYAGIYSQQDIESILDYLDQNNIVVKSPDGIYEISTASISQNELAEYKKNVYVGYNDITKYFNEKPTVIAPLKKIVTKNNNKILRKTDFIPLSTTLKPNQIDTILQSKILNKYMFYVVMFFSHGPNDKFGNAAKERDANDINKSIEILSKKEEYNNVVFVNALEPLTDFETDRFVEIYARALILDKNNNQNEAKAEHAKAASRIGKWIQKMINDGEYFSSYRGNTAYCNIRELANNISDKYIPALFSLGLDRLKNADKETIWEEKKSKAAVLSVLGNSNRDEIEQKLSGGMQTNLKCLLKDDSNTMYIFDDKLQLVKNAPKDHPMVRMINEVEAKMDEKSANPIIHLGERLSFLFKEPYGYYGNPICYTAVAIAMKKYVNKIFDKNSGLKISETNMGDRIENIFNFNLTGKGKNLEIRFSSGDELELIDTLNSIFKTQEDGLMFLKWKIRELIVKKCNAPIWILKYVDDNQTKSFNDAVDNLFTFTISSDEGIGESVISDLLKKTSKYKTEFGIAFDNASQKDKDVFGKYILMNLKDSDRERLWTDDDVNDCKVYIMQKSQENQEFWQESQVALLISKYCIELGKKDGHDDVEDPPIPDDHNDFDDNEKDKVLEAKELIKNYTGDVDSLKTIVSKIIEKHPYLSIANIINEELGGRDE